MPKDFYVSRDIRMNELNYYIGGQGQGQGQEQEQNYVAYNSADIHFNSSISFSPFNNSENILPPGTEVIFRNRYVIEDAYKNIKKIGENTSTIQEEISKIGNINEIYRLKTTERTFIQKQIEGYNTRLKEFKERLNAMNAYFIDLRHSLNTYTLDISGSSFIVESAYNKEHELMKTYTELYNNYSTKIGGAVFDLQSKQSVLDEELAILQNFIVIGMNEIIPKGTVKQNVCTVCIERSFDTVLIPCGHTYCKVCSATFSNCPLCRTSIEKKNKLFITN